MGRFPYSQRASYLAIDYRDEKGRTPREVALADYAGKPLDTSRHETPADFWKENERQAYARKNSR